jgi:hypothetical protein
MGLTFSRMAVVAVSLLWYAMPASAGARELATAQGTIVISEPRTGLRAPTCSELIVEARDALDDRIIAETQPATDQTGACRYALSVPAQTAIWLRPRPALVAGVRILDGANADQVRSGPVRPSRGSVAIRFTLIASATYFFVPNERKTVLLIY